MDLGEQLFPLIQKQEEEALEVRILDGIWIEIVRHTSSYGPGGEEIPGNPARVGEAKTSRPGLWTRYLAIEVVGVESVGRGLARNRRRVSVVGALQDYTRYDNESPRLFVWKISLLDLVHKLNKVYSDS